VIPYTGRQLVVLLAVVVAAGAGLAIGEWRRARPELAAALEALDRADDDDRVLSTARAPSPPSPARAPSPARPPAAASPAAAPVVSGELVDLNRASMEELTRLPGIGPKLAARIIAARESGGAFESVDDLRRVAGVGPTKLSVFRERVTVSR
jgi:competence protein ComEA